MTTPTRRIGLIVPSSNVTMETELPARVTDYLADAGIEVVDSISLNVTDNCAVGRLDPGILVGLADRLDLSWAEALVLSACVQMPSLASIPAGRPRLGTDHPGRRRPARA